MILCIHEALLCIAWLRCVTRAENKQVMLEVAYTQRLKDRHPPWLVRVRVSSKRFAGEVIWSGCALGFNETCFGFCVFVW